MNFDGIFCSSKLIGDLLVEHAGNYHRDHLLLADSQRVEPVSQLRPFFLPFAAGTILIPKWFRQEVDCPRLHGANTHWDVAVTRHKNDRDLAISRFELTLQIEPA